MSGAGLFIVGVLVTLIVAAAMALLVYAAILDGRDAAARRAADREPPPARRAVDILQTARAAGSLHTLLTAIDRAGLSDVLEHEGPYTVFAPSDEAFANLPDGAV
ncbi:MAG: fasciclin domain-containing protein [Solirubrobacterales bacterium]|nr:fasciclin domain-containing protein [Solirubrobacterales bacterium]